MFSQLIKGVLHDLETVMRILRTNDKLRAIAYTPVSADMGDGDSAAIRLEGMQIDWPSKIDWQIFDHCAAFTRIYALYEQFVTDLISEYLKHVPLLYQQYSDLPLAIRNQHRVAVGQILQKWSDDGPYKSLTELGIVKGLADGLANAQSYKLLPDAFLIEPNNYRLQVIRKLFRDIGVGDCWPAVAKFPKMIQFMSEGRDATENAETILHGIIAYRNGASHTNITNVVSVDEIQSYARFIIIMCEALGAMLKRFVLRRRLELNQGTTVGTVIRLFGRAIGINAEPGHLEVGEELIVQYRQTIGWTTVQSIQQGETPYQRFSTTAVTELGLVVEGKVKEGTKLYRLAPPLLAAEVG